MLHQGQESSSRKLVWVEERSFVGWGCSECAWVFNLLDDLPIRTSLCEIERIFKLQLSDEFASHACAIHPRIRAAKSSLLTTNAHLRHYYQETLNLKSLPP
jgi:hypothetical protein